jgi:hypothetical protein
MNLILEKRIKESYIIDFTYKSTKYWYLFDNESSYKTLRDYKQTGDDSKKQEAFKIWKVILNRLDSDKYYGVNVFKKDPTSKIESGEITDKRSERLKRIKKVKYTSKVKSQKDKTTVKSGTLNLNAGQINSEFKKLVRKKEYKKSYTGIATIIVDNVEANYLFKNGRVQNVLFEEPVFDNNGEFDEWTRYPIIRIQIIDKDKQKGRRSLTNLGMQSRHNIMSQYRFMFEGDKIFNVSKDQIKFLLTRDTIGKIITNELMTPEGEDYSSGIVIEKPTSNTEIHSKEYVEPENHIQKIKNNKAGTFLNMKHKFYLDDMSKHDSIIFKNDPNAKIIIKKDKTKTTLNKITFKVQVSTIKFPIGKVNMYNQGLSGLGDSLSDILLNATGMSGEAVKQKYNSEVYFEEKKDNDSITIKYKVEDKTFYYKISNLYFKTILNDIRNYENNSYKHIEIRLANNKIEKLTGDDGLMITAIILNPINPNKQIRGVKGKKRRVSRGKTIIDQLHNDRESKITDSFKNIMYNNVEYNLKLVSNNANKIFMLGNKSFSGKYNGRAVQIFNAYKTNNNRIYINMGYNSVLNTNILLRESELVDLLVSLKDLEENKLIDFEVGGKKIEIKRIN